MKSRYLLTLWAILGLNTMGWGQDCSQRITTKGGHSFSMAPLFVPTGAGMRDGFIIQMEKDSLELRVCFRFMNPSIEVERGSKAVFIMTDSSRVSLPVFRSHDNAKAPAYLVRGQAFPLEWKALENGTIHSLTLCTSQGMITTEFYPYLQSEFSLVLRCLINQ